MLNSHVYDARVLHSGAAGVLLVVSAFLPWMTSAMCRSAEFPTPAGWWIFGLGVLAVLLAGLSIWTRKNSRHPLLLVGLAAFAIMFLGYQWMSRDGARFRVGAGAGARDRGQRAGRRAARRPSVGPGIYLGCRRRDRPRAVRAHHRRQTCAERVRGA